MGLMGEPVFLWVEWETCPLSCSPLEFLVFITGQPRRSKREDVSEYSRHQVLDSISDAVVSPRVVSVWCPCWIPDSLGSTMQVPPDHRGKGGGSQEVIQRGEGRAPIRTMAAN